MKGPSTRLCGAVAWSLAFWLAGCVPQGPDPSRDFQVLANGRLGPGLDLGVDSCPRKTDWVHFDDSGQMNLAFPTGTNWGAVTFLLGPDDARARSTEDFSGFEFLRIRLTGDWFAPQLDAAGVVTDDGLAVSLLSVGDEETQSPAGCYDRPQPPPNRDVKGRECWLAPRPSTNGEKSEVEFRVPLAYFDVTAQDAMIKALWSPALLVLGRNLSGSARQVRVKDIALVPRRSPELLSFCEERCPPTCLRLEPTCEAMCPTERS